MTSEGRSTSCANCGEEIPPPAINTSHYVGGRWRCTSGRVPSPCPRCSGTDPTVCTCVRDCGFPGCWEVPQPGRRTCRACGEPLSEARDALDLTLCSGACHRAVKGRTLTCSGCGRSCTPEELALHDHGEYGPDLPGRSTSCGDCGGTGLVPVVSQEPPDYDERECRSCASGRSTSPDRREIERDVLTHVMRDLPLGTDLPSALWGASRALICTRDTEDTDD